MVLTNLIGQWSPMLMPTKPSGYSYAPKSQVLNKKSTVGFSIGINLYTCIKAKIFSKYFFSILNI